MKKQGWKPRWKELAGTAVPLALLALGLWCTYRSRPGERRETFVVFALLSAWLYSRLNRDEEKPDSAKAAQKAAQEAPKQPKQPEQPEQPEQPKQPAKPLFSAAGRPYISTALLTVRRTQEDYVYYDCYGRMVLYLRERFPCFDSYDYLYENRYYHTYAIRHGERWTVIKTQDESDEITIMEDLSAQEAKEKIGYWAKDVEAWLK